MDEPGESRIESFLLDSAVRSRRKSYGWRRVVLVLLVLLCLFGWYWSRTPALPVLTELAEVAGREQVAAGVPTTAMLRASVFTLLEKPGGYLANDVLPPGVWLDNMPAFERGALRGIRDMVRAMRRDFSHSAAVAVEDPDLKRAEARLLFEGDDWLTTESEYREALVSLDNYLLRLDNPATPGAHFYARSDAFARWLADVDLRLDDHVRRLNAAARGDDAGTSWSGVDDEFFEARGYAWALRAQLDAVAVDFAVALRAGNGSVLLVQAARQLDGTQQPVRSPMIMNGSEFGVLANHSLVMAGYLAGARAALQQIRVQQLAVR